MAAEQGSSSTEQRPAGGETFAQSTLGHVSDGHGDGGDGQGIGAQQRDEGKAGNDAASISSEGNGLNKHEISKNIKVGNIGNRKT